MNVEELMEYCKEAIENGKGKHEILISDDDEGNGFHYLFYSFQPDDVVKDYGYDPKTQIILG